MATLVGEILESCSGGRLNDRITIDLIGFDVDYWPPHDAFVGPSLAGARVSALPVSASPRSLTGDVARAFSLDYYYRIHIRPTSIALGNLVSTQVVEVELWNAFMQPVTLLDVTGIDVGLSLTPSSFPVMFGGLEQKSWDLSVSQEGSSSIDLVLTWSFDGIDGPRLPVTGSRVTAWPFVPDWSDGITERLEWLTDVLASQTGFEQRRMLRQSPRRTFSARCLIEGRERALYDLMVANWGGRVWAMPVWPDAQRLTASVSLGAITISCDTTGRDFSAGGIALLRSESAFETETVEIESVATGSLTLVRPTLGAWPAGTRLYPLRTAQFTDQPQATRLTDQLSQVPVEFMLMEPSDWTALGSLPTYRSFPVYATRPDESDELTETFQRLLASLDNSTGIPVVTDFAGVGLPVRGHRRVLGGMTERADFRSLLYLLAGRLAAVWIPTHADDLHLAASLGGAATTMTVENIAYARFGIGQSGHQDIRIELHSGSAFHRRITGASALTADTEQLTLDSALGVTVNPVDVRRISFMTLSRGNDDAVEIEHLTDLLGVAKATLEFRGVRDDDL